MNSNARSSTRQGYGRSPRTRLFILALSCGSVLFNSCTTEEGIIVGALAGAAIGGVVGHSHEHSYRRAHHYSSHHYGHSGHGYYPRYPSYRGRGYVDPYCY